MNYISLFSGMECAWQAWHPLGWACKAVAEIEPAACTVLGRRLNASQPKYLPPGFDRKAYAHLPEFGTPGTLPNWGDVSQVTEQDVADLGLVDLLIGGSPCQDLSVAGKRRGLAGARSGLFHQQLRIFHAARHLCGARWLVWENVPGALSSHQGRDFAVVVGEMAGLDVDVPGDGWGTEGVALGEHGLVEYGVLDAQWFGVAQRRRRVFAVLDTGDWASRSPVLLERESLRGDSAPRREAGQRPSGSLAARTSGGGGLGTDHELDGGLIAEKVWPAEVASTLNAAFGDKQGLEDQHALNGAPLFVPAGVPAVMGTLTTRVGNSMGARDVEEGCVIPMAVDTYNGTTDDVAPTLATQGDHASGNGALLIPETAHTLRADGFDASEDGTGRGTPLVPVSVALRGREGGGAIELGDDVAFALRASQGGGDKPHVLAFAQNQRDEVRQMEVAGALAAEPGMKQQTYLAFHAVSPTLTSGPTSEASHGKKSGTDREALVGAVAFGAQMSAVQTDVELSQTLQAKNPQAVATAMAVRRLTPRECERLQGVEDDWTLVPNRNGKPMADGPRYKMLGNSFARPVITWIGQQIERASMEAAA